MNRHEATQRTKAIACLRTEIEWLAANPYNRRTALAALATLDDTYEGFSNRETWAACQFIKEYFNPEYYTRWEAADLWPEIAAALPSMPVVYEKIGSLWRVNWDEVANALLGGE